MNNFEFPIKKDNLRIILAGVVMMIVGYLMMIGGGSENPNEFKGDELFSTVRITVSPIVIILGIVVVIFGIMKKSKISDSEDSNTSL